jgi:hypothetical protein
MLNRLFAERRSAAAMEFAMVAPLLVVLLFGVYDLSTALIYYEEVYNAAHSIAASVSNQAVVTSGPNEGVNSLTFSQVQQAESMLWGEIPPLRADIQDGVKSITISSIVFESTVAGTNPPAGTNYVPVVVWSEAYAGGTSGRSFQSSNSSINLAQPYYPVGSQTRSYTPIIVATAPLRSCSATATIPAAYPAIYGSLNQTAANAGSSGDLTNMRTTNIAYPDPTIAPPAPILVVDVHLHYSPPIGLFLSGGLDLWVSAYWPVRSVKASASTTYPLYQEFTTMNPSVPASVPFPLSSNGNPAVYTQTGTLAPINNYCVNTTMPNASFPYPAEVQNP